MLYPTNYNLDKLNRWIYPTIENGYCQVLILGYIQSLDSSQLLSNNVYPSYFFKIELEDDLKKERLELIIDVKSTGQRIVQARELKRLTRFKLAQKAKVDLGHLGKLEEGTLDNVTIEFLNRIAIGLEISTTDLLSSKPIEEIVGPENKVDQLLVLKRTLDKLGTKELEFIGDILQLPVRGNVRAGMPCVNEQEEGEAMIISRAVVESLTNRPNDVYALRISGESLSGDDIHTGDHILVLPTHTIEINGELYIIRDPDTGESVVRHIYKTDSQFRLESSNPDYKPLTLNSVEIIGRVLYIQPQGKRPKRK